MTRMPAALQRTTAPAPVIERTIRDELRALGAAETLPAATAAADAALEAVNAMIAEREASLRALRTASLYVGRASSTGSPSLLARATEQYVTASAWYSVPDAGLDAAAIAEQRAFAICDATIADRVGGYTWDEDDDPAEWEEWDRDGEPHDGMRRQAVRETADLVRKGGAMMDRDAEAYYRALEEAGEL